MNNAQAEAGNKPTPNGNKRKNPKTFPSQQATAHQSRRESPRTRGGISHPLGPPSALPPSPLLVHTLRSDSARVRGPRSGARAHGDAQANAPQGHHPRRQRVRPAPCPFPYRTSFCFVLFFSVRSFACLCLFLTDPLVRLLVRRVGKTSLMNQ
jgi:hypothetical protein